MRTQIDTEMSVWLSNNPNNVKNYEYKYGYFKIWSDGVVHFDKAPYKPCAIKDSLEGYDYLKVWFS